MIKLDPDADLAVAFDITCLHTHAYWGSSKINKTNLEDAYGYMYTYVAWIRANYLRTILDNTTLLFVEKGRNKTICFCYWYYKTHIHYMH